MIKKIKFLPVIILATMYLVGFIFAFSGDLITQIQTIRQHNQVNKRLGKELYDCENIDRLLTEYKF